MKQIYKFYITEFLKTQRYFIPIMILFLQFNKLSYMEIFILYTIESLVVFLLEIPSGVLADRLGKKFILILSRAFLLPAYIIFAFADNFILFLAGIVFIALNKAFKSGTHKAYIYDYIEQKRPEIPPSEIFGKAKFWGRMGEASASLIGGFIAVKFGYNTVFLFCLLPSVLNVLNTMSYKKICEEHTGTTLVSWGISKHVIDAFREIKENNIVLKLIINSSIFMICMETAEIYFQPYMVNVKVPLEWFGTIYMAIFVLTAVGSRYAYLLEKKLSRVTITNLSGWFGIVPLILLGSGLDSKWAVFLFFLIFFLRHIRRPAITTEINRQISSEKRATILSVDSLFRSLLKLALLPMIGYLSEIFSIYFSIMILAFLLLINQIFFSIPKNNNKRI